MKYKYKVLEAFGRHEAGDIIETDYHQRAYLEPRVTELKTDLSNVNDFTPHVTDLRTDPRVEAIND